MNNITTSVYKKDGSRSGISGKLIKSVRLITDWFSLSNQ